MRMRRHPSRRFWLSQLGGWVGLHALLYPPYSGYAAATGVAPGQVALQLCISCLSVLVASSLLAYFYLWLPPSVLRGRRAIGLVGTSTASAAAFWTLTERSVLMQIDATYVQPPAPAGGQPFPLFPMLPHTIVLAGWSALFFAALLSTRMHQARQEAIEAKALAKEAQLELLRSKLDPHFLFNALNSIVGLIAENPHRARQMVRDVSHLLRRSLNEGSPGASTIGDELDFIELYLRCQKVRFEDRLRFRYDLPPSLLSCPLPRMLLHPLVENALKHGMARASTLDLLIRGRCYGREVTLEVINNGSLAIEPHAASTGTGLQSVEARIHALDPGTGRLELIEIDGFVMARLRFDRSWQSAA